MSNIKMLHRVYFGNNVQNLEIYDKRQLGLLYNYDMLEKKIACLLSDGYQFGTIKEACENSKVLHLTFDDGYIEHLEVAMRLKKKFSVQKNHMHFAINVRNVFEKIKICTDVIYQLITEKKETEIIKILRKFNCAYHFDEKKMLPHFDLIKEVVFTMNYEKTLHFFQEIQQHLAPEFVAGLFLNKKQVIELSKHFEIASHSINHIYLDVLDETSALNELQQSKHELENLIQSDISVFCYPDGRNTREIQKHCKKAGYQYGLSIKPDDYPTPYCIPRSASI